MLWMREPFLTDSDTVDCGRLIVHGHTPRKDGKPELRPHRLDLDTAAVLGGPLTAAAFDMSRTAPAGLPHRRDSRCWRASPGCSAGRPGSRADAGRCDAPSAGTRARVAGERRS